MGNPGSATGNKNHGCFSWQGDLTIQGPPHLPRDFLALPPVIFKLVQVVLHCAYHSVTWCSMSQLFGTELCLSFIQYFIQN